MTDADDLVEDLKRPWRHGEHLDATGVVLDQPLRLDGLEVRGLDLSGATLNGGISAKGTLFRGLAWFRDAKVLGTCDFTGATFRTDLRADGLSASVLNLDGCVLQGVLSLAHARLQKLSLMRSLVMANLTLEGALIAGTADLTGAEIMGGLWTAGARLGILMDEGAEVSGRIQMPD